MIENHDAAPLGRYAFATNRIERDKVPMEPNTDIEDELLQALVDFVMNGEELDNEKGQLLRTLTQRKQYIDVIKEPASSILYRGLALRHQTLLALLTIDDIPAIGEITKRIKLEPNRGAGSSWTDSKKIARTFADEHADMSGLDYKVIISASRDDNPNQFIAGPDGFYNLQTIHSMRKERESIGIGTIIISHVEWERTHA